jgi:hypothetical protein
MNSAKLELADVVRQFRNAHAAHFGHLMLPSQKKALDDIAGCMTPLMGGHLLVTAGGVSDDGRHWLAAPSKFLLPVRALSKIVRARFRDALEREKPAVFHSLPRKTWKRAWCCYCKPYGHGKQAVLQYLARYAFRIAITNARLLAMDDTHVTFRYKDREANQWRTCRLVQSSFLRRLRDAKSLIYWPRLAVNTFHGVFRRVRGAHIPRHCR